MNGRRRLAGRRRSAPWVVLVVAPAMFLASIGLTLVVAFTHENRSAGIEALLGSGEE